MLNNDDDDMYEAWDDVWINRSKHSGWPQNQSTTSVNDLWVDPIDLLLLFWLCKWLYKQSWFKIINPIWQDTFDCLKTNVDLIFFNFRRLNLWIRIYIEVCFCRWKYITLKKIIYCVFYSSTIYYNLFIGKFILLSTVQG